MRLDPILLVIDFAVAAPVRRDVGPTAWVVLETLAASSPAAAGVVGIDSCVRDLASEVGLSKDTIARAVRRLLEAGIVGRTEVRDQESGRFARSTYVVDLDAAGLSLPGPSPSHPQPDTAIPATASGTSQLAIGAGPGGAQLSLLDVGR